MLTYIMMAASGTVIAGCLTAGALWLAAPAEADPEQER